VKVGFAFDGTLAPEEMLRLACLAEEQGFDSLWMAEDLFYRDSVSMTAAFALQTQRINLSIFVSPYTRNPAVTAMTLATLDELSEGRMTLTLGTGNPLGLHQMGIPLRRPLAHVAEFIDVFRSLLDGRSVSREGSAFRTDGLSLSFRPHRNEIPIYIAAMREKMVKLAAESGDGVLLTAASSVQYIEQVGNQLEGTETDIAAYIITVVDPDLATLDDVRMLIGYLLRNEGMKSIIEATGLAVDQSTFTEAYRKGDAEQLKKMVTDEILHAFAVVGSAEECATQLNGFLSAGLDLPVILPIGSAQLQEHTIRALGDWWR